MSTAIVWFRQDLRTQDNPALALASREHDQIIPLYILSDENEQGLGSAQRWWLHHSLIALTTQLNQYGLSLCLRQGSALSQLNDLINQHDVDAVYWNRCYEPDSIARDRHVKDQLKQASITVMSYNGSLLNEPWTIKNKSQGYFKVFTPYWKQALLQTQIPCEFKLNPQLNSPFVMSDNLNDWQLLPANPNWANAFPDYWQPGEIGAEIKLNEFKTQHLSHYKEARNIPYLMATSKLSPHLHFGEISPWQIWRTIEQARTEPQCNQASVDHFFSELGWREFSYHLLYHFPGLPKDNFRTEFNRFPWHEDDIALKQWQQGLTGFPIVDAGMRELWHTGYMHNRVRMIVGSFLVKDLLIDWRKGAAWFLDTLLDADLANNSASWQWVAGCGADAAPYFRIFNPLLQSEKFDPKGEYIKHWIPELANIPTQWIHQPWLAPEHLRHGLTYPKPMVDHATARIKALSYFDQLKQTKMIDSS